MVIPLLPYEPALVAAGPLAGRPGRWSGRAALVAGIRRGRSLGRPDRGLPLLRRAAAFLVHLLRQRQPLLVVLPPSLTPLAEGLRQRGHRVATPGHPGLLSNWRTVGGPLPAALLLLDPSESPLLAEARRLGLPAIGPCPVHWDPTAWAYPLPSLPPAPLAALLLPLLLVQPCQGRYRR